MNAIAVVAVVVAVAAGCAVDATDQPAPNPPHGEPGHDHSRMHTSAAQTEDG